ncbi:MBL fold metallo-hydrolase [Fluviicola sp.]|uniref:MBL fold metallo-hydrolase n=1 Tax=Fluviicola sp. TaxID=1917219 RepID=UPI0031D4422A
MKFQKLNDDCSWLWELNGLKIMVDPWFTASQIDGHRLFSEQFHQSPQPPVSSLPAVDYLFISNRFTDHCNKETLLQFDSSVPVIAKKSILKKIAKWNHFKHLIPLQDAPLPIREYKPGKLSDLVHSAYLFDSKEGSVLFAPHGAKAANLPKADVLITTTTRYHLPFWLGGTVNLGIKQAELLYKQCGAKLFLSTHDEQKLGKGFVEKLAVKHYVTDADFVTYLKANESISF